MRNEPATFASQVNSREYLDFDGKLFVSAEYWYAQWLDRIFSGGNREKPKVQTKPERPVFGRRAA